MILKKKFLFNLFLLKIAILFCQENHNSHSINDSIKINSFKHGEWFEYRIHYGFINAGFATLEIIEDSINNKAVFHSKGYGKTVGLARLFFKVEDFYESYFDKFTGLPYKFIRNIYEGGYTKNTEIFFNHKLGLANVDDKKNDKKYSLPLNKNAQDMISAFYYLRNFFNPSEIKVDDTLDINMFFDNENYIFKLKFLGIEILETKFGKINCLKLRPYVQSGRVFKAQESVTLWVSNDKNKLPIRLQANLAVGAIKCDLENFKNLNHPFSLTLN
tara:strand:- start:1161 stop:1979 length:819 start_codon:yes stop_codon:yes gene_type:complete